MEGDVAYFMDVTLVWVDGGHIGQVSDILPDTGNVQPEVILQPLPRQV